MPDPHLTRSRIPLITAVLLSLVVVGAEVLFDPSLDRERYNDNFYPHADTENYFPDFNHSQEIFIVDVYDHIANDTLDPGMGYTMSSLQGLVNRESARILIDYEGWLKGEEHLDYWDFFMDVYVPYYNLTVTTIDHTTFFELFHTYATGVVVYDEDNEHTINIACTMAGLNDWLVADRKTAPWLEETFGLEIKKDLHSGWGGSRAEVYEKSFETLYPDCNQQMLFASIPSEWGTDYLMACKGFVFCLNPGPFTTPAEKSLMIRIMEETPADIPVLGWFEQPTGVEENYMIQLASRNGKIFLGGFRFPNKSFFTAFAPPDELRNPIRSDYYDGSENGTGYPDIDPVVAPPPAGSTQSNTSSSSDPASTADTLPLPPDVGNKIYIALAVTDGDNLGFMTRKMRKEMWNSEIRGTIPLAWSVNPLLKEIVPCLLDYYYSTPTENDTFVAGPSGIGYFNPDFCSEDQLDRWLDRTAYGMEALDLRQVWLLNSFTTYETYYSDRVLSAYTRKLWPDGMMLDYGDVPEGRKMWMQEGDNGDKNWINPTTPVIRSMHIWGDTENFVGKLLVESQVTPDDQPIFAFAPIMSADLTLESIPDLLDDLETWKWAMDRDVEFVSIDDLFYLMERNYVKQAREMEGEDDHFMQDLAGGKPSDNAKDEYRSLDAIRDAMMAERSQDTSSMKNLTELRHLSALRAYEARETQREVENQSLITILGFLLFFFGAAVSLMLMYPEILRNVKARKPLSIGKLRPPHEIVLQWLGETGDGVILFNGLLLIMTMLIFFMTSFHVLYLNFWHYGFFLIGVVCVLIIPGIGKIIERKMSKLGEGKKWKTGRVGRILRTLRDHDFLVICGILILLVLILPFKSVAYSLIPYLCVRLFRQSERTLKKHTLHWILLSFLIVTPLSLFLREYSFPVVSIVLLWFGLGIIEVRRRDSLSPSQHPDPGRINIPAPLFTALLLTMFIVIIDIPFNRYMSIDVNYRLELLPWFLVWIPVFSVMFSLTLYLNSKKNKTTKYLLQWSVVVLTMAAGIPLLTVFSQQLGLAFVGMLFFGASLVMITLRLASDQWEWIGRGKRIADWTEPRFFEVLVILLILGLIIVTMPPIAFTVYVMSVPVPIAYIMYSLPATLLIISLILLALSLQISPLPRSDSKPL